MQLKGKEGDEFKYDGNGNTSGVEMYFGITNDIGNELLKHFKPKCSAIDYRIHQFSRRYNEED